MIGNRRALALLALGLAQMAADVLNLDAVRGVALATGASPAPRVFSAVRGLETYSTRFVLEWTDTAGAARELALTPHVYARLDGPYNRRNAYGAALAAGPVLATDARTEPMFRAVMAHALCGEAPVLSELGIDPRTAASVRVRYEPLAGTRMSPDLPRLIEARCP